MGWVIHHFLYVAVAVTAVATLTFYLPLTLALGFARVDCLDNPRSIVCSDTWLLASLIAAAVAWVCLLPLAVIRGLLQWLVYLRSVQYGEDEWFPVHLQWILQAYSEFRADEKRQEALAAEVRRAQQQQQRTLAQQLQQQRVSRSDPDNQRSNPTINIAGTTEAFGDSDRVRRVSIPQRRVSNPLSPLSKPTQVVMVVLPVSASDSQELSPGEMVSTRQSDQLSNHRSNNNNFVGPASRVTSFSLSRTTGNDRIDGFEDDPPEVNEEEEAKIAQAAQATGRFLIVSLILILCYVACQTIVALGTMSILAGTLPLFLSPPRVLLRQPLLCSLATLLQSTPFVVVLVIAVEDPSVIHEYNPSTRFLLVMLALTPLAGFLFAEMLPTWCTHAAYLLHRAIEDEDELDICDCNACRIVDWALQVSFIVRGVSDNETSKSKTTAEIDIPDPNRTPRGGGHKEFNTQNPPSPQPSVITSKDAFQVPRMSIFSPSEQSAGHLRTIHRFETSDTQLSSISTTPKEGSFSHSDPHNRNSPHGGVSGNRVSTVRASINAQRSLTILFVALRDLVSSVEPEEQQVNVPCASTSNPNVEFNGGGGGGGRRLSIAKSLDLTPITPGLHDMHRSRIDQLANLLEVEAQRRHAELLVESDDTFCVVWGLRPQTEAAPLHDDPIQLAVQLAEAVQLHPPVTTSIESGQMSSDHLSSGLVSTHVEPRSWTQIVDGQIPFHLAFGVVQTRSATFALRAIPGAEKRVGEALLSRSCALRSPMVLMDYTATFRSVEWCIARPIGLYVPHTGRPQAMYEVISRLSENLVGEWHHVLEARERLQLKSKHLTSAFEKVEQGQWDAAIKILKDYIREGPTTTNSTGQLSTSKRQRGSIASQTSPSRAVGVAVSCSPNVTPLAGGAAQTSSPSNEILTAKMFLADLTFALQASQE